VSEIRAKRFPAHISSFSNKALLIFFNPSRNNLSVTISLTICRQYDQDFFKEMKQETGVDLENIVYYKDEVHFSHKIIKRKNGK
jgi:hypothetical protein